MLVASSEEKKCPKCDDIMLQVANGFFCPNCAHSEKVKKIG